MGDARGVIEPLVRQIRPDIDVAVDGGEGFGNETVEVRLQARDRRARCVVTFEAWENARHDPGLMEDAFRQIVEEMEHPGSLPAYVLTTRGLTREPTRKKPDVLRTIAGALEADRLAEEVLGKSRRKQH
ncbi:MAG: hypothetical protein WD939_00275 [Dehalococcoidia bacterium]